MSDPNGQPTVMDEDLVYDANVELVSLREKVAYQRMAHWRTVGLLVGLLSLGLVVAVILLVLKQETTYKLVGITEEGHVRVIPLSGAPWNVSQANIRGQLHKWLMACRNFGTDEIAIQRDRLTCWNLARKPAQGWISAEYTALPVDKVGKVAIRVAQPPEPPMRFVPPTAGRTWEVYWHEEWTTLNNPLAQRKAFLALITVQVKEPESDQEAEHLGVWIENVTVEERIPASDGATSKPLAGR